MSLVPLQIILTAAACFGLWRLWRFSAVRGRVSLIVGAGFLIRAFAGQILFWISWLHLPVARSLQTGNGFWFFAIDGPGYLAYADELIGRGAKATLFVTSVYPSRVYIQFFTAAVAAFGTVESVAILFNCAAYLLTCAIIERIGPGQRGGEHLRLVALAAVSFGPGTILWSLQPLKDTFFFLLVAAMIGTCLLWQELWSAGVSPKRQRLLGCAAAMIVLTYAIGGIRWYFAAIIWASCFFFFILAAVPARPRSVALMAGAFLFVLLAQAVRLGGEGDIPPRIRRLLDPLPASAIKAPWQPSYVTHYIGRTRIGFEHTAGATEIFAGPAIATLLPAGADALITGFSAMFIPRVLGQALGLVRIGGGRGFWLFAEADTLVLDAMVLFAIAWCVRALRSQARITPLFVLLVLVLVLTAVPMMYTVSNFGTLFRLRQMVYILAAILPLTLARRQPE
jgi:hypothetical protein